MKLSQAFEAFTQYKRAEGMSENTVRNYYNTYHKMRLFFFDDPELHEITHQQWIEFLAWIPDQFDLSPKTCCNIHTNISSLYTWAIEMELLDVHIIQKYVPRPRYEHQRIDPLTHEEVNAILRACDTSRTGKRRHTAVRDRAIVLTLLSTGMRASELCNIRFQDLDLGRRSINISGKGRGRDSKGRQVFIGKRTATALWKHLTPNLQYLDAIDYIFWVGSVIDQRKMTRDVLSRLIRELGRNVNVRANPHRFRHTFATNYLRNGGDSLTLQRLLGHESLEMVKRYTALVSADLAAAHKTADPVDNWRL